MKQVTVNVQIQIDLPDDEVKHGVADLTGVHDALDAINEVLQRADLNCQPQILTEGVDDDDVSEAMSFEEDEE